MNKNNNKYIVFLNKKHIFRINPVIKLFLNDKVKMRPLILQELLLHFLRKYFFILKAAADGWRIRYIGGNQFQFFSTIPKHLALSQFPDTPTFLQKYTNLI